MNAEWLITTFVLIDTLMEQLDHRRHTLAQVPDAEIVTVAVVAAKYFHNHHERALCVLRDAHSLSGRMDLTRFNRRWQALAAWRAFIAPTGGALFMGGEVFVIDRLPGPVYRRGRARRCRKGRGRAYGGSCAAKREKFFGWRLPLMCTPAGVPVSVQLLPARLHDVTPVQELAVVLPPGARLLGDKAYNSAADEGSILAQTGVRLLPVRRAHMAPHAWFLDDIELPLSRHTIETVNSP